MFEKLLANLPYNPALLHQMGFYARRLRREQSVRRLGMVFIVLAFVVQFLAVMNPPQPTVADSVNDLINGGFSAPATAVSACQSNLRHYRDILAYYGISCSDVGAASTISLRSTDYSKQLYSMGWKPVGAVNQTTHKTTGETPVTIPNVGTLYWRYLWSWDTYSYSTYRALQVTSSQTHKTFFILYNCGNLVSVGLPKPYVAPAPAPQPKPTPAPIPTTATPIPVVATTPKCPYNTSLPATSPLCFAPCQYNASIAATSSECKPCEQAQSSDNLLACAVFHKKAEDQTHAFSDPGNLKAQAGDVILYTLTTLNNGKASFPKFVMQENLSDVLDYVGKNADGSYKVDLHGGTMDQYGLVSWPAMDIAPAQTETHQITVTVADPIPQTPASVSDPSHFDLIMTNVYGDTVNISVPGGALKTVSVASTALPNTGPGSSLIVAGLITLLAGYFFARTRLLAKEAKLAVQEHAIPGGL